MYGTFRILLLPSTFFVFENKFFRRIRIELSCVALVCLTKISDRFAFSFQILLQENCSGRYIKMTQRVGLRFAEHQAMQQKRAAEEAAAGGIR
jgi:hypothetical protein